MTTTETPTPAPVPAKKGGAAKWIVRGIIGLVVLIVIALVALYFAIDPLVKRGVVSNSKEATNLETGLNSASVSLMQGTVELAGLDMANYTGYQQPHFVTMNKCAVTVQGSSLLTDTVQVESINIDGLEVTLEVTVGPTGLKSNLADILEEIKKRTALAAGSPPGKSLKIGSVSLSRTKVHIRLSGSIPGLPAQNENMDLDLPPLTMKEPTNPDGRMEKIADLVGDVLAHVAKQIMDDPRIMEQIKNPLRGVMASLEGKFAKELTGLKDLQHAADALKDIKNPADALKGVQDLGKDLPGGMKDLGKDLPGGMKDLLNPKPPAGTQK